MFKLVAVITVVEEFLICHLLLAKVNEGLDGTLQLELWLELFANDLAQPPLVGVVSMLVNRETVVSLEQMQRLLIQDLLFIGLLIDG